MLRPPGPAGAAWLQREHGSVLEQGKAKEEEEEEDAWC